MRKNLSPTDRDVRVAIIAPLGVIFAVSAGLTTAGGILMLTCVVMTLISAFTGYSPFYELFDIDHAPAS
jgi:hypothetical protein